MMKKNSNKGKKSLTAVGALVAAGLTPGIVTALPTQGSNAGLTAAEVVAIDGNAYSFDELSAIQRENRVDTSEVLPEITIVSSYGSRALKYGVYLPPQKASDRKTIDLSELPVYETIYRSVEQMPRFPGGEAALMKYLDSHIVYPPLAAMNEVEGRVVVQFVVKKDGSVGEVKIVRSVDKDLDKEAIRVVKSLPKFTPGRQNGKAVNVWYTLPVPFKLK